jgi:hypothetical protein
VVIEAVTSLPFELARPARLADLLRGYWVILAATRPGGVPLLVEKQTGAGSHRRILRGGGDSPLHHLLLES